MPTCTFLLHHRSALGQPVRRTHTFGTREAARAFCTSLLHADQQLMFVEICDHDAGTQELVTRRTGEGPREKVRRAGKR